MGVMMITHDLGVVAETCDTVAVMYAGNIVEYSSKEELFKNPKHPYTQGLLASLPRINENHEYLPTISGNVPSPYMQLEGCRFANRCPHAIELCKKQEPELTSPNEGEAQVRCWIHTKKWNDIVV
jgi:peptide/nickel transport system ATP-binding protein/oligopeptide transport system ATP-binding protein